MEVQEQGRGYTCVILATRLVQALREGIDPEEVLRRLDWSTAEAESPAVADCYREAAQHLRAAIADAETADNLERDLVETRAVA